MLVLEGLIGLHRTVQLHLQNYWLGHRLELLETEWFSRFPHFLQFKSDFGNKEFMI